MKIPKATRLPSGSWRCRVQVDGEIISITRQTEKEAVNAALALKTGLIKESRTPVSEKTLFDAAEMWIEDNKARLSPSTVRGYVIAKDNGFKTLMGMKCSAVTDRHIAQAINAECKKFSAKTVKNRWGFVSQVLTWATGKEYTAKLPQVVRPDIAFLDQAQLDIFMDYIKGKDVEILALLALSSLRRSEIAALDWNNIDLKHRWIHVRGAMVPDENHQMVTKATNKNSTSRRDVPIIDPLYAALQAVEDKTGAVVKVHPATMLTKINKACAAAGVPEVGCHGLRHSFASLCHILNIPPQVAMEIGGWSDRATMDRIYTHVSKRDKDAFENAFTAHFKSEANKN
jgi:integrase